MLRAILLNITHPTPRLREAIISTYLIISPSATIRGRPKPLEKSR
jgi:hypothetical protein